MSADTEVEVVQIGNRVYRILFPDLLRRHTESEFEGLRRSIMDYGVQCPVILDENRGVIEGATRVRIAKSLGYEEIPEQIRTGLTHAQKEELAWDLNYHRRHLTLAQLAESVEERQRIIAERQGRVYQARENGQSIRAIAQAEEVSTTTVMRDIEAAQVPTPAVVVGRDNRVRPQTSPATATVSPDLSNVLPIRPLDPDQPRPIYDEQHVAVPTKLRPAFDSKYLLRNACAAIREARKLFEEACRSPAGVHMMANYRQADVELNRLAEDLHRSRPYAICPRCEAIDRGIQCEVCKGLGWVRKAVFNQPGIGRAAE